MLIGFLDRLLQLRQGLIREVFEAKASQRIQVSMCLPSNRDLDTWYDAVYALPISWPDIADIGAHYFWKTSANQLLVLSIQLEVSGAAPLSFVDENEAVNHILQVVCREEIAMGINYKQSQEVDSL